MSEYDPSTTTPPPAGVTSPQEERTLALVAHLLGILTWFVGALIIWLISKDNPAKAFVTDQSKEALNFQITLAIAYVISWILMMVSFGLLFFLPMLVWVANVVFSIVAAIKANNGETYRYPVTLRLVR